MESPQELNPSNKFERIALRAGEAAHYSHEWKTYKTVLPDAGAVESIGMNEFTLAKDGPRLRAWGGDCPIISFYNPDDKLGCLLHISAAHLSEEAVPGELIDLVAQGMTGYDLGNFFVYLFMDTGDEVELENQGVRESWHNKILGILGSRGFTSVTSLTKNKGKEVSLDTESGELEVKNDNIVDGEQDGILIFRKEYLENNETY